MKFRDRLKKELNETPGFKENYEKEKAIVDLAVEIASLREKMGLTQAQLAEKAHITQQQLSKVERGSFGNFLTIMKIVQALNKKIKLS